MRRAQALVAEGDITAAFGDESFGHPRAGCGSLITTRVSDIEAKPVSWLWPGNIAYGKLTIIAGNPGLGKSQITASIAAIVTTGGSWPITNEKCEPGEILFLTAEDDAADTLRPRLEAAGANLTRVHVIDGVSLGSRGSSSQRTFSLRNDIAALGRKLAALTAAAAVVIDPISAYLGDVDSYKNADVCGLLAPLMELAARCNVAIIGISHLNKSVGAQALMRVSGSTAFVAAARAAWLVAEDRNNPGRRLFLPMKNNLGPDASGLAYSIEPATFQSNAGPLETSFIKWESSPVTTKADEVMHFGVANDGSALQDATDWLEDLLAQGQVPARDVLDQAKAAGFSEITIRRAQKKLQIKHGKSEFNGGWAWSLPSKMTKTSEDSRRNC